MMFWQKAPGVRQGLCLKVKDKGVLNTERQDKRTNTEKQNLTVDKTAEDKKRQNQQCSNSRATLAQLRAVQHYRHE